METMTLTLDRQKRVSLAKLLKGIKTKKFDAYINSNGNIELKPVRTINEKEYWPFENKDALKRVEKGI